MAREARLRGKDMILGPAINIQRIPTGGRTYEYLSEDPYLSSCLSVGYTKGVQDNGVAVCVKHFALNNQETNRGSVNVIVSPRAMREIYLPPFEATVVEGNAFGVMAAYNKINGTWCAENPFLLDQVLRKDWGFNGMVISDWGGTHSTVPRRKRSTMCSTSCRLSSAPCANFRPSVPAKAPRPSDDEIANEYQWKHTHLFYAGARSVCVRKGCK